MEGLEKCILRDGNADRELMRKLEMRGIESHRNEGGEWTLEEEGNCNATTNQIRVSF